MMPPRRIAVIQGQYEVSCGDSDCCMTTVLGSCISVCMLDPVAGAGGMNHFLLGDSRPGEGVSASYGVNAMELLINGLLKLGADRGRLHAHVHGGARMLAGLSDVGARNADFAIGFLRREGIGVIGQSLGGRRARRVDFWPASGLVRESFVRETEVAPPQPRIRSGTVELF